MLELHQRGWTQRGTATALGAAGGTVSRWLAAARPGGREALATRLDRRRVAPESAPEQVRLIPELLRHGAEAYGFRGDVRVAGVLREEPDVTYSKILPQTGHFWLLTGQVTHGFVGNSGP